jgi:RNA ligase (TIGR02306 family)
LRTWAKELEAQSSVILHGEIFGNVQDLRYGLGRGMAYAAFDLSVDGVYVSFDTLDATCRLHDIPVCPVIYRGPFDESLLDTWANGESVIGGGACIREGVVLRPVAERTDPKLGRVILKRVGDDYLLRKGGSENH